MRSGVGSVKFYYQTWLEDRVAWSIREMGILVISKNQDSVSVVKRLKSHDFKKKKKSETWDGFSLCHSYLVEDLSSILCS